jgi:hypothetical protein
VKRNQVPRLNQAQNAEPTSRPVHALLGNLYERLTHRLKQNTIAKLTKLFHTSQTLAITQKDAFH